MKKRFGCERVSRSSQLDNPVQSPTCSGEPGFPCAKRNMQWGHRSRKKPESKTSLQDEWFRRFLGSARKILASLRLNTDPTQQVNGEGPKANGNAEAAATPSTAAEPLVDHTQRTSEVTLETTTATPERRGSRNIVDHGREKKVRPRHQPQRDQQPRQVEAKTRIQDGQHPTTESVQPDHGARHRKQRAEGKLDASTRVSPSSRLKSSSDGRTTARGRGGPGGGGDNTYRKSGTPVTATTEQRRQQRHRGAEGSGADPHHPQHVDAAHGARIGPSTSVSSSSENDKASSEHPSAWDVEQPVTGLANVDSASTMNGLLDREVSKRQGPRGILGWAFLCLHRQEQPMFRGRRLWK